MELCSVRTEIWIVLPEPCFFLFLFSCSVFSGKCSVLYLQSWMKNQNSRKSSDIIWEEFLTKILNLTSRWESYDSQKVAVHTCIGDRIDSYWLVGESDYSQGCISDWKGLDLTIMSKNRYTEDVQLSFVHRGTRHSEEIIFWRFQWRCY